MQKFTLLLVFIFVSIQAFPQVSSAMIPTADQIEIDRRILKLDTLKTVGTQKVRTGIHEAFVKGLQNVKIIKDNDFNTVFYSSIKLKNKKVKIDHQEKKLLLKILAPKNTRHKGLSKGTIENFKEQLTSRAEGANLIIISEVEIERSCFISLGKRVSTVIEVNYEVFDPQMVKIKGGSIRHKTKLAKNMDPEILFHRVEKLSEEILVNIKRVIN